MSIMSSLDLFLHQHPNLIHPPNFEVLMTPCLRCVSRRKWKLLTAWASIPVPLTWLIFSLIYWALGGTNYDGDNFIYPVLKFVVVIALMMATLHCKCHHLGEPTSARSAVFLNIVQKAFDPPPLSFEHLVGNFSEGFLTKVRKCLSRQLSTK